MTCPACGTENPEGFRFCGNCGAALTVSRAPERRERKVVTVLFADLVGFTSQAEALDPEDVRAILDGYHARLRAELEEFLADAPGNLWIEAARLHVADGLPGAADTLARGASSPTRRGHASLPRSVSSRRVGRPRRRDSSTRRSRSSDRSVPRSTFVVRNGCSRPSRARAPG